MLVQIIKVGKYEYECDYSLDAEGKLAAFEARELVDEDMNTGDEVYHLSDFTESEQAAIVQTLTGC